MVNQITCFALKGGVGKSTLAIQIVQSLLLQGRRVAIRDLDQQQRLQQWAAASPRKDLIVENNYNYIVVDTPPILTEKVLAEIKKTNVIIIPTVLGLEEITPLIRSHNIVRQECPKDVKAGIILNQVDSRTKQKERFLLALKNQLKEKKLELLPIIGELPLKTAWKSLALEPGIGVQEIVRRGSAFRNLFGNAASDWENLEVSLLQFLELKTW